MTGASRTTGSKSEVQGIVLHDYICEGRDDVLSIHAGQIISNIEFQYQRTDNFSMGTDRHGKHGLFPNNRVHFNPSSKVITKIVYTC